MHTPLKMTKSFIRSHGRSYRTDETAWIKAVYSCIFKVARSNGKFTVDDIWAQIDKMQEKGTLPKSTIDHRILGPMIRHMVSEGLLGSTGYYAKSVRPGGGSRPVTIWESYIAHRVAA